MKPTRYSRGGIPCFLDLCRGKLVSASAEEEVRQWAVQSLAARFGYPIECITTELRLSPSAQRADIVIFDREVAGVSEHDQRNPLMVIECKRRDHPLPDAGAVRQVAAYATSLRARFAAVTNGIEWLAYRVREDGLEPLLDVPTFSQLRAGLKFTSAPTRRFVRLPFKSLGNLRDVTEIVRERGLLGIVVGEDTPPEFVPLVVDLHGCFADGTTTLPAGTSAGDCRVVEDLGPRPRVFGNSAGGVWYSRHFRSFIVERRGQHSVVSLGVLAQDKTRDHPRWGNAAGYSTLAVAIDQTVDDYTTGHLSMELKIEKSVRWTEDGALLTHNGRLTRGGRGAMKVSSVKQHLQEMAPDLLDSEGIVLGALPFGRGFSLKKDAPLILNVIRYGLLRDDLRYRTTKEK